MPWEAKDAKKHNKNATGKKARQWAHVADGELASGKDEGTAIKIANGVLKREASKSLDVFTELEVLAKGFATEMAPFTESTVRQHTRDFQTKKTGTRVKPFRRRRFKDPSQMRGIKNVQDV